MYQDSVIPGTGKMAVYEIMSSRPALASGIYLDKSAIKTIVDSGFRGVDFCP